MYANVECLSCRKVEVLDNFQLSDMRYRIYDDTNAVTKRLNTIILQLHLIWTPVQVLEYVKGFQGGSKTPGTSMMEFFVTFVNGCSL